jgi:hypothetical protein
MRTIRLTEDQYAALSLYLDVAAAHDRVADHANDALAERFPELGNEEIEDPNYEGQWAPFIGALRAVNTATEEPDTEPTIREAIRAYIDEQGDALDPEWLQGSIGEWVDDELTEAGWVCDDETLEWGKKS